MAGRIVDEWAVDDFAGLPHDLTWSVTIALFAETATELGNRKTAAVLLAALEPFSGLVLAPILAYFCFGTVDRFLGMLATTLGRYDDAERWFTAAIELEERIRSRPLATRSRLWYGRMLLRRNGPGDTDAGHATLSRAFADADDLGMAGIAAEAGQLLGIGRD